MKAFTDTFPTPIGSLFAAVDVDGALLRLDFLGGTSRHPERSSPEARLAKQGFESVPAPEKCAHVRKELEEYFAGRRREFGLRTAPPGTEFQRAVWAELRRIPFGTTRSYSQLAQRIGNPNAVRAVARANATNPISIVVPCHRVIGSDGTLTGYAGGLERKRALLELEGVLLPIA